MQQPRGRRGRQVLTSVILEVNWACKLKAKGAEHNKHFTLVDKVSQGHTGEPFRYWCIYTVCVCVYIYIYTVCRYIHTHTHWNWKISKLMTGNGDQSSYLFLWDFVQIVKGRRLGWSMWWWIWVRDINMVKYMYGYKYILGLICTHISPCSVS